MSAKIWKVLPQKTTDLKKQLLINRNLLSKKEIEQFFNPKITDFPKLTTIPGITKAKKRILQAIKNKETIFVYGDYDVDGVTASAIIYHGLKSLGATILPYIPHRDKGYGLSISGLEEIKNQGGKLIITVDNGIVALEPANHAQKIGLDLIITDHHLPLQTLPQAVAIVHSTAMCGAGVAWCLMKKMVSEGVSKELLQFVLLGTIADLIPLTHLGRAFAVEGLRELRETKNPGLRALITQAGLVRETLGAYEVGYILGPRLNAIGRLEHAIDALRLLCTKDPQKARELATFLGDTNTRRQDLTQKACDEALLMVKKENNIHIVADSGWVPGIIGLIASRVVEEYKKPVIAISIGEEFSKGSARSINGLNIIESIRSFSTLLVDVGGHAGAAGFTIETSKIGEFKSQLENYFASKSLGNLEQELIIEAVLERKDLNLKNAYLVLEFEPFGSGNQKPTFTSKAMEVSDIRTLKEGKHLKFKANGIDAIAFNMGQLASLLKEGMLINLAYNLEINRFNGNETLQLKVKDIEV